MNDDLQRDLHQDPTVTATPKPTSIRALSLGVLPLALVAALAAAAAPAPATATAAAADEIDRALAALEAPLAQERRAALERLAAAGDAAVDRALAAWPDASARTRRELARLFARSAGTGDVGALVERLGAGGVDARVALVRFLGRADHGGDASGARVAALARLARADASPAVRAAAVETLGRVPDPAAAQALDALFAAVPADEHVALAKALAAMPLAREHVLARVRAAFAADAQPQSTSDAALAELLGAYGRVLAEVPGAGARAVELMPLPLGLRHPAFEVQRAAREGLDALLLRYGELGQPQRALDALEALVGLGWDEDELDSRRAVLALRQTATPGEARAAGERLVRRNLRGPDRAARTWRFYGELFVGAAAFAERRPAEALAAFDEAGRSLAALRALRYDLRPLIGATSESMGALDADLVELGALVHVWSALCLLADGAGAGERGVLEHLRAAHVGSLRAQLEKASASGDARAGGLDEIIDRALGPRRLVLLNARLGAWDRGELFTLQRRLGEGLASVAPWEMPGFAPAEGLPPRLGAPLMDSERLTLLLAVQDERLEALRREIRELSDAAHRQLDDLLEAERVMEQAQLLQRRLFEMEDERARDAENGYPELRRLRVASDAALRLAQDLRAEGRAAEAIEVGRRMLADLERDGRLEVGAGGAWIAARIEMVIGGSLSDEGLPAEAERELARAELRLREFENSLRDRMDDADVSAEDRAALEANVRATQLLRSDALTSLAVNANVRLGEPERALAYFEEAFALNQNDFMRVLLACYRARSGQAAEARAQIAQVAVSPSLFYNLACTYALLGDAERALDYLARELSENHPTQGSLERQRAWARTDPDLVSLRDDPRFRQLVGDGE